MTDFVGWSSKEEMRNDFSINNSDLDGINIIIAAYEQGGYDGAAFVLFEKNGTYFEVNGSHCSCYGLEGQWKPEEVYIDALKHRVENGYFYVDVKDELKEFLKDK